MSGALAGLQFPYDCLLSVPLQLTE